MKRRLLFHGLLVVGIFGWPLICPAPLTYRPGEGWTYEAVGADRWERGRAKEQFEVAQEAFDKGKYGLASKAAKRTVSRWPLSDYAPAAQFLLARCHEIRRKDEKAFKEYQGVIEKYPKIESYDEILQRQYEIANRFLGGQWFKLWGFIPFFPSMDKTADMYAKIIRNGPYSGVARQAQLKIGTTREKQKDYLLAVRAYERAADRYHDDDSYSAEAFFRAGLAYQKQAKTAEYDQSAAQDAIDTFNDFLVLFPSDGRVPEAQKIITDLKTEQSRGALGIARYYEKKRKWLAAEVYYNEAISKDPTSPYAEDAKVRLQALRIRTGQALVEESEEE